jgi:hypothetical protein
MLIDGPAPDAKLLHDTCRTLIRRGDVTRINELIGLLRRFGDKELAEEYLNCGNPDLSEAGSTWAREHGYIPTKFTYRGSDWHVRWGNR